MCRAGDAHSPLENQPRHDKRLFVNLQAKLAIVQQDLKKLRDKRIDLTQDGFELSNKSWLIDDIFGQWDIALGVFQGLMNQN
ncbi:MAG: hypothetical protein DRR04_13465, partial [Gammaproteobacteria bacterium]